MTNDKRDIKRDIFRRDIMGKNKRTKEHEGFGHRNRLVNKSVWMLNKFFIES